MCRNIFFSVIIMVCFACKPEFRQKHHVNDQAFRPNILWIVAEDMSDNWSCYGESTIQTPNIDQLASEGELFENAFVTSPVCSPCRSSLITGMYQTTIGAHNHRSQKIKGKAGGNESYYNSFQLPENVPFLPSLLRKPGIIPLSAVNQRQQVQINLFPTIPVKPTITLNGRMTCMITMIGKTACQANRSLPRYS